MVFFVPEKQIGCIKNVAMTNITPIMLFCKPLFFFFNHVPSEGNQRRFRMLQRLGRFVRLRR